MSDSGGDTVVLVHGLWMNGWEMGLLGWRLRRCGFSVRRFHYSSTGATVPENAAALAEFIERLAAPRVHLVGHSLGGLVVLRCLHDQRSENVGHVVLLGSPVAGSEAARRATASRLWASLMGEALGEGGLAEGVGPWQDTHRVGMIAGRRSLGLGWLAGGTSSPSDGTVAVAETHHPAIDEHLTLYLSHMELVVSGRVAQAVCRFLKSGDFSAGAGG